MITDVEIVLNEFLGDDMAQHVTAEMGLGIAGMGFLSGFQACHRMLLGDDEIDHEQLAGDVESAIEGLFIGPNDEPEWHPLEGYEEEY